ncbi:MAG: FAD-dependent oxidoreductase [Bacteroidota bacterium]|nr:FAD-dependent oxidoreductase [Bacteroidota bacterium]
MTLYKPNAVHSPMLSQKGEGHISAALGIIGSGLAGLQADAAVSDHVGLMTNGMYHYRSNNFVSPTDTGTEKLNIYFVEGGIGIFDKFGKRENMLLQIYAGGGYGKSEAKISGNDKPDPKVTADVFDAFIQPGIVFKGQYLDMGVDMRLKFVRLFNLYEYKYNQLNSWSDYNYYSTLDQEFVLFEPTFTMMAGGKNLKGLLQAGFTIPVINSEAYFRANSVSFFSAPIVKFNIGITYAFSRRPSRQLTE